MRFFQLLLRSPPFLLLINDSNLQTARAPPTWNTGAAPQNITFDTTDFSNLQSNTLDHHLDSQQPRSCSKSDTPTRPPTWGVSLLDHSSYNNNRSGVNLNDVLPSTSPQPRSHISFSSDASQSAFSNPPQSGLPNRYTDCQYLTPDMALTAPGLRRARSDGGRPLHRHSRSEGGISYPLSSRSDSIARAAADEQQFLHPTETIPNIGRGHHRSSSGSRDRGIGAIGLHSAPGSSRASPYSSPNTSPLLGYHKLPSIPTLQTLPPGGTGELSRQPNTGEYLTEMGPWSNEYVHRINSTASATVVSKPSVMITATAEASERRRNTDAYFVCPVPGCGSTFTRHLNLKGMSHRLLRKIPPTSFCSPYAFA